MCVYYAVLAQFPRKHNFYVLTRVDALKAWYLMERCATVNNTDRGKPKYSETDLSYSILPVIKHTWTGLRSGGGGEKKKAFAVKDWKAECQRCERLDFLWNFNTPFPTSRLWDSPCLVFSGYWGFFFFRSGTPIEVVTLTTHLHVVQRLRMRGAIPPLRISLHKV